MKRALSPSIGRLVPSVTAWARIAAARGLIIVAGLCEADGDRIYNSAVAIGPTGALSRFRKVHLWDQEKRFFIPGDLGFPVIDTPFGRIGMAICYDGWFPEILPRLRSRRRGHRLRSHQLGPDARAAA